MRDDVRRVVVGSWGVGGVLLLLLEPAVRLGIAAVRHMAGGLSAGQWGMFVVAAVTMAYLEGYRGFSCSFCPRVVERAFAAPRDRGPLLVALAPLYAMSLFGDERRRVATSWGLVVAIVFAIVGVRTLPPTWRAIIDGAVALSLTWGVVILVALWAKRVRAERRRVTA